MLIPLLKYTSCFVLLPHCLLLHIIHLKSQTFLVNNEYASSTSSNPISKKVGRVQSVLECTFFSFFAFFMYIFCALLFGWSLLCKIALMKLLTVQLTLQLSDNVIPIVAGTCKTNGFCCGQDTKIALLPMSVLFADSKLYL